MDYPVAFTRDALSPGNSCLLEALRRRDRFARRRVLVAVESEAEAARPGLSRAAGAYARAHAGSLILAGEPLLVPAARAGRESCPDWLRARLWAAGLGERGHFLVIGGEALQNAAAFAAGLLDRPPRLTRLPAAALAQIACVGARARRPAFGRPGALSLPFAPHAVVLDSLFLDAAGEEERKRALAEALRLALAADADFFHWIADRADALRAWRPRLAARLVRRAAALAAEESAAGGFARGTIEALEGLGWPAAEAAGTALAVECLASIELAGLEEAAGRTVLELLAALGFTLWDSARERELGRVAAALWAAEAEGAAALCDIGRAVQAEERRAGPLGRALKRVRRQLCHRRRSIRPMP